ncbi:MAG: TonB-dependent receptor [Mangrovibacterium sp.]
MKLTTFFFFVSTFTLIASGTFSQNKTFTINRQNVQIKDVLQEIEDQSGYFFIYNNEFVDVYRKINIHAKDKNIKDLLDTIFQEQDVTYSIQDRRIILSSSGRSVTTQQPKSVSGKVTDSNGQPLPGVTVVVKGTTQGTITDMDGRFTLTGVLAGAKILVFSFVGMKTQEVPIGDKGVFSIQLEEETVGIEEVIAIGYGTMKKVDMTGSAASVSAADIVKAPVKSFDEAMAGRVAGVQITSNDGQPGSLPSIVIRGANSITQDNSPLYVIDGFPIEDNDNNAINPNDIESVDILKDASATAIYGARGANGVIMITTKRGNAGTPVVSYDGYYGFQKVTKSIEMMNPYEFVKLQLEMNSSTATTQYLTNPGRTLEDYKSIKGIDWFDKCLQTAPMQNHSLSVRGGSGNSKYSVSGSFYGMDGIFINTGFNRWQARITLDQVINSKLTFGVNVNHSDTKKYGLVAAEGGMNSGIMHSIWSYRPVFPEPDINLDFDLNDPSIDPTSDYRTNPVLQLKNEHRESFSNGLIANGYIDYKISKELKLRISGGISKNANQSDIFNNSKSNTGNPVSPSYKGINGSERISNSINYSNENTITWTKKFDKGHSLNIVGGFSQQMGKTNVFGATVVMITNEDLGMSALDEGSPTLVNAGKSNWVLQSFLCRANYNYKSKYLITTSIRADGSSKLAPANRWGYFPSAALAYRLSAEDFMKQFNFVSDAKIRISYGATGNNRVSDFAYLSSISSSYNDYSFGNAVPSAGSRATTLGNANLKWETTSQFNVGTDLSFFKNRLSFTGDYYYKKTTDLLLNASMPYISGYATSYKNIGSVSNSGFELTLNSVNLQNTDFKWNSSFNISFNKNKILSLTDGQESLISDGLSTALYLAKIGHPIAQFYGAIYDGMYTFDDFYKLSNGAYILKDNIPGNGNTRQNIRPGDARYKDLNGDMTITTLDLTIIGDPNPDFIGGFNNNFQYKGFDLSILFQFSYGNDVANVNRRRWDGAPSPQSNTNQFASFVNRWTVENPDGIYPRSGGYGATSLFSSRLIEDASFLRLKTVSLGYTFSSGALKSLHIKSARVYGTSQNLYTWTGYTGLDPEVSTRNTALTPGFDYSPYPRALSVVFGINLTF